MLESSVHEVRVTMIFVFYNRNVKLNVKILFLQSPFVSTSIVYCSLVTTDDASSYSFLRRGGGAGSVNLSRVIGIVVLLMPAGELWTVRNGL